MIIWLDWTSPRRSRETSGWREGNEWLRYKNFAPKPWRWPGSIKDREHRRGKWGWWWSKSVWKFWSVALGLSSRNFIFACDNANKVAPRRMRLDYKLWLLCVCLGLLHIGLETPFLESIITFASLILMLSSAAIRSASNSSSSSSEACSWLVAVVSRLIKTWFPTVNYKYNRTMLRCSFI